MNWYAIRKMLYGFAAGALTDGVVALGIYFSTTAYESWLMRAVLTAVFTAIVAGVRRRYLPGFLGSQN